MDLFEDNEGLYKTGEKAYSQARLVSTCIIARQHGVR